MKLTGMVAPGCAVVMLLLASPQPMLAYADPGSGALLYQVIYAAILGGTFYFRRFLNRVFSRRK